MSEGHVLIVDDDLALLQALPEALRLRMAGLTVDTADSGAAALDRIAARDYDAIVTDIKMPGMDGLELLAEIRTNRPDTPTLMITGHGEHDLVVHALRAGAYDFIQKPIDRDYFVASLRRAIEMHQLGRRVKEQQLALERHLNELEAIVEERTRELRETNQVIESPLRWLMGPNGQMEKIVQQIKQVADSPLTVLVEGETGTGKELVARAVHQLSARREKPFIAVDCGAIPDTLIESELFGYEKGAFTGAQQRKEGQFELADGGTLFLDEIVNLPLSTQTKLLRALQERQVQRLGGKQPVRVDVRIIAASNVPLEREVRVGRFRQDVYYRLNEFVITLPPLRERDDVLHLANGFLAEASMEFGRPCPYVPTSVRQPTPLSLVCRAGRRRELDQELGAGRSGDDHGGHGAERRRAKRGAAERRVLHGRARVVGPWEGCARSRGGSAAEAAAIHGGVQAADREGSRCLQGVG